MNGFQLLIICVFVLVVVTYFVAVWRQNTLEGLIIKKWRWIHYFTILLFSASVVTYVGSYISLPFWLTFLIGLIPGLAITIASLVKVLDNEYVVIQNIIFTKINPFGFAIRMYARPGIFPLLLGEVIRTSWTQETRKFDLTIKDLESKDDTPLNGSIVFSIAPNFNRFQEMLSISTSQSEWWSRISDLARGLVTARASDLLKDTTAKKAVRSKEEMSSRLNPVSSSGSNRDSEIFEESRRFGFDVVNLKFADIDHTPSVTKANELVQKIRGYNKAAIEMLRKAGVTKKSCTPEEYKKAFDEAYEIILAANGKSSRVHIRGAEGNDFLKAKAANSVL